MLFTSAFALLSLLGAASAARIHPRGHNDLCVQADRMSIGASVSLCNGQRNQQWDFSVSYFDGGSTGMAQIRITDPGTPPPDRICLEVGGQTTPENLDGFQPYNGAKARLAKCPAGWHSARMGTDFIHHRDDGRLQLTKGRDDGVHHYFLDVTDGRFEPGTPVQVWENALSNVGNPNQTWDIEL